MLRRQGVGRSEPVALHAAPHGVQLGVRHCAEPFEPGVAPEALEEGVVEARPEDAFAHIDQDQLDGFRLRGGEYERISVPGSAKWQPAIWEKGVFTPLTGLTEELGADMAEGFGINVHGQVVGHFTGAGDFYPGTSALKMYGFVYTKGQPTVTLNYPGSGIMSCAMAIGTGGEVVGHYTDIATAAVAVSGFLWQKGSFAARLVVPGAIATYPTAITPSGVIAGYAALGRPNETGPGYIVEEWVGFTAVQKRGRR
jgi:hypothetical protein